MPTQARTIVFVHGIGNKPPASVLKCQWDHALAGRDLGERSRLAYWVNRAYYPSPSPETCGAGDLSPGADDDMATMQPLPTLDSVIDSITTDPGSQRLLRSLSATIESGAESTQAAMAVDPTARPLLPEFVRRWITRRLTEAFLKDVNDYFYVKERRAVMRDSVVQHLRAGGGPFVVIGHSQGSMIAYDVLSQFAATELDVPLFVSIGSPLGITEVQDEMRRLTRQRTLAVPECVGAWLNAADRLDPVALDAHLRNDYTRSQQGVAVQDEPVHNPDSPRHPHSGSGYLATPAVRTAVANVAGL